MFWYTISNGVAERKNKHLHDTTRALLFQMKVPKQFWADVVSTACFLINRMSSTVLDGNVLYSVLFPNKSLFLVEPKVFGNTCYVWDVRPSVTKLDPKALKCIFGLFSSSEGVSILLCCTRKIFGINLCGIFKDYTFILCTSLSISQGSKMSDWSIRSPMFWQKNQILSLHLLDHLLSINRLLCVQVLHHLL